MEFTDAIEAVRSSGKFTALRRLLRQYAPLQTHPVLQAVVQAVETARNSRGFIPFPGVQDPAQSMLTAMRAAVQPELGMLLLTVPGGNGVFCMADGARYVFCSDIGYTVVTADKTPRSQLLLINPGIHPLLIAGYGPFEHGDPMLVKDPTIHLTAQAEVAPGCITEVVCSRGNVFSKMTFHLVYHW